MVLINELILILKMFNKTIHKNYLKIFISRNS